MKVRNKTLYAKVQKFLMAAIMLLKKIEAKERLPIRQSREYSFEKTGLSMSDEFKVDFSLFVFKHFKELDELSEFVDCAEYILKNPVTRKAMGWKDKDGQPAKKIPLNLDYFRILYSLLVTYLRKVDELSFEDERFREVYIKFESYIYKSILPYKITAPLQGFSGTISEINFGNNLKLRRILDSERVSYLRIMDMPLGFSTTFSNLDIMQLKYKLETVYFHQKETPLNTSSCRNSFEDIITTLRLFKSGRVDFSVIKTEATTWTLHGGASYSSGFSRQGRIFPDSYKLNEYEKAKLLRLWKRFKRYKKKTGSSKSGKYINIALKRFNFGMEESDVEDKTIDFLIAFEALFLPDRKGELTYRLSNRVAILLGKDDADTEKIRKFMTKAYDLRSGIVHGKDVQPIKIEEKTVPLDKFVQKVEEYLRKSLKSFIALSRTHKKQQSIIALLDKSLLNIKSRRKLRSLVTHQ